MRRLVFVLVLALTLAACGSGGNNGNQFVPSPPDPPPSGITPIIDLANFAPQSGLIRLSGSDSTGRFGVPVAGGADCNGDGFEDYAMSGMQASPLGRVGAGQVWLVLGDGTIGSALDSGVNNPDILIFAGAATQEATGGEIWIDDITGDGLGDVIIGRPNFRSSNPDRIGAGAITIVAGDADLRLFGGQIIDLSSPPPELTVFTLSGEESLDRAGFWMRTGDITGDGINDLVFGADQADIGASNSGVVYLIRGGEHLAASVDIDLANAGGTPIDGHLITIDPPAVSTDFHFGATVSVLDLDQNNRSDILIAASLSRVGGLIVADGAPEDSAVRNGGNLGGSVFIFWDDNFPQTNPWPQGLRFGFDDATGSLSRIDGDTRSGVFANERFGEDLLGGEDFDNDGNVDLYVGDIRGDVLPDRTDAGTGFVFFDSSRLKNLTFSTNTIPSSLSVTTILGTSPGAISADTSLQGDIDGDGIVDLVISSPLAAPENRVDAGQLHIFWGQTGPWPETIDLSAENRPANFSISDIYGANGRVSDQDQGDTLMYSAAPGDVDGDGLTDLIVNEMRGNGMAANAQDTGNLLVISGATVKSAAGR